MPGGSDCAALLPPRRHIKAPEGHTLDYAEDEDEDEAWIDVV